MSTAEADFLGTSIGATEISIPVSLINGSFTSPERGTSVGVQEGTNHELVQRSFQGILQIDGINVSLPEQTFESEVRDNAGYIQNAQLNHWPVVRFAFNFSPGSTSGEIEVRPADRTVEAIVLVTRLRCALNAAGTCRLVEKPSNRVLLDMSVGELTESEYGQMLLYAKVSRKLRFLEEFFGTQFECPDQFTTVDLAQLETLFRGVTEGEFSTRAGEKIVQHSPSVGDLSRPAFSGPGGPLSCTFAEQQLLGQRIETGPITMQIERAVLANRRDLSRIGKTQEHSTTRLRFVVLDSQVKYRFENYAGGSLAENQRKLDEFKSKLLQQEPQVLVQLLTEPLISDVSSARAIQIVNGWLQYCDFPDRYSPQEPVLEGDEWRVPVWITYPTVRGAKVEDVFVNVKTGVIRAPLTPAEMLDLGKSVASKILRAS